MELIRTEHREADRDDRHYTQDVYTIGKYTVTDDTTTFENGNGFRSVCVRCPMDREGVDRYLPRIEYLDGYLSHKEPRFAVQTAAYGAMPVDEFEKFLEAQKIGLEVAVVLNRELLKKEG